MQHHGFQQATSKILSVGWVSSLSRGLLLVLCVGVLSSCGFQLRTWKLDGNIETMLVTNNTSFVQIGADLERAIGQTGVTLLTRADTERTPQLQVQLEQANQNRRSISVGGDARAAEYELLLEVNFVLLDDKSVELIEPRWIRVRRVFRINRGNLMGSNEEETILKGEMRADVVQQILRAINQVVTTQDQAESAAPLLEPASEPMSEPEKNPSAT